MSLFENERYLVTAADSGEGTLDCVLRDGSTYFSYYEVVNRETGVVEFKCPSLPEAINAASVMDVTMRNEPWQWFYKEKEEPITIDESQEYLQ